MSMSKNHVKKAPRKQTPVELKLLQQTCCSVSKVVLQGIAEDVPQKGALLQKADLSFTEVGPQGTKSQIPLKKIGRAILGVIDLIDNGKVPFTSNTIFIFVHEPFILKNPDAPSREGWRICLEMGNNGRPCVEVWPPQMALPQGQFISLKSKKK